MQFMGDAIRRHREESRVAEDDLVGVLGRGSLRKRP